MKTLSNLSFRLVTDVDVPAKSLQVKSKILPCKSAFLLLDLFKNVPNKNRWKNITTLLHGAFDSTGGHDFYFIVFLDHNTVEWNKLSTIQALEQNKPSTIQALEWNEQQDRNRIRSNLLQ